LRRKDDSQVQSAVSAFDVCGAPAVPLHGSGAALLAVAVQAAACGLQVAG